MGKIRRNIKARYKAVKEAVTKPCTRSTSTSMSTTSSRIPSPVPARRGPGRPRKHGLKPGRPLKKAKTTKNSHNVIYSKYVYICNCHCSKKNINYHCLCLDFKRTTISLKTQNSYRLAITGWREIQKMGQGLECCYLLSIITLSWCLFDSLRILTRLSKSFLSNAKVQKLATWGHQNNLSQNYL